MRIRAWRRESSGSSRITSQPLRPIVTSSLSISMTRPVSLPLRTRSAYFLSGVETVGAAEMRLVHLAEGERKGHLRERERLVALRAEDVSEVGETGKVVFLDLVVAARAPNGHGWRNRDPV